MLSGVVGLNGHYVLLHVGDKDKDQDKEHAYQGQKMLEAKILFVKEKV